ncbi:MAG TPA: universal stress protein [Chloroflexota bacterium]|nr:universal stress protein [Chloroflexota bacterium]
MRVLVAIGPSGDCAWLARLASLLPAATTEVCLAHVVDLEARRDWERARQRFIGRPPLPPHRRDEVEAVERERGRAVLAAAEAALRRAGCSATTRQELLTERPERALVALATHWPAELLALRARDAPGHPPTGPGSVGHVARFVLDHAPCPVLLVRATGR